jgi:arylsulfatase A-like enzyme
MTRVLPIILCGVLLPTVLAGPAKAVDQPLPKPKRPNIVLLFADDQRADTIGAHGNEHIQTPNLDRLAREGFSFRRNYCAGSFSGAVCVASRAMLMTGRHWMNLPREKPQANWGDATTLPTLLKQQAGYKPFIVGKWHNGKETLARSFSNGRSVYMGGMANHADFQVQDLEDGELSPKKKAAEFSSTEFANEAVRFIESHDGEEPCTCDERTPFGSRFSLLAVQGWSAIGC